MYKKQHQLILELAKRLKKEKRSVSESVQNLEAIGILSPKGKVNKHYPNLERVLRSVPNTEKSPLTTHH